MRMLLWLGLVATPLFAGQVLYTISFTGSGTFDGASFTNQSVTIQGLSDPAGSDPLQNGTVTVGGVLNNLPPSYFDFCGTPSNCVEMRQYYGDFSMTLDSSDRAEQRQPYPLTTGTIVFNPTTIFTYIAEQNSVDYESLYVTAASDATYRADPAAPEPSAVLLCGAGFLALLVFQSFMKLRKRTQDVGLRRQKQRNSTECALRFCQDTRLTTSAAFAGTNSHAIPMPSGTHHASAPKFPSSLIDNSPFRVSLGETFRTFSTKKSTFLQFAHRL